MNIAKEVNEDDEKYSQRIAYAKFYCIKKMYMFPNYFNTAIGYISDVLISGDFQKMPKEMFLLYFYLADMSILTNEVSIARAAIENAFSLVQDEYDIMRCNAVKGKIATYEGEHDEAIALFQKTIDSLNLKIATNAYKDNDEYFMIKQNLAVTFNDIAISYRVKGNIQCALVYVQKAVDASSEEDLEFEHAIFLIHWADMLFDEELYDFVIEKAITAQKILFKRDEKRNLVCTYELIGTAYFRQGNLPLSCKTYLEAFNVIETIEDKLRFSHKIVQLSAMLGNEQVLNEHISFIREFESFDKEDSLSAFEEWVKRLRTTCLCALPDQFKKQPGAYLMFDEENADIIRFKNDLLQIHNCTSNVNERREKVKDLLMKSAKEFEERTNSKKNDPYAEKQLKSLFSRMNESKSLKEKAQLMYEIGGWYYHHHNGEDADAWFLKAMKADGASAHTVIWAKITHAQVLMNKKTIKDDEKAKVYLDEVECSLEKLKEYEAIAFCRFNRGRLEARKGNFKSALELFEQSYKALEKGKIDSEIGKELKEYCFSVNCYMHFEDNPTESLSTLQSELVYMQTWYPEYSEQLTDYWWHYRANEPLNNVRISALSVCAIVSDDKYEICWYSEALRFIFSHCLFAPKESWENIDHIVNRIIPVPFNTPFPYSFIMVNNEKIGGKVYGYQRQTDDSSKSYAYKRLKDEESFDKDRDPKPITLAYFGYSYPKIVSQIIPMVDEFGSCRWWVGAEFGGSPNSLMNLVSRFGVIPVFHFEDINAAKEITILRSERIDVPFITDEKKYMEGKHIRKELRRIASIIDQVAMFLEFDKIIDHIGELPQENIPLLSIHFAIVRFNYYIWTESPVQLRTYPIVIIDSEDVWRNAEIDSVIAKSVAIRDAVYLTQKLSFYAHHNHGLDKYYIKKDALRLLELSKYIDDEDMAKTAYTILNAFNEL